MATTRSPASGDEDSRAARIPHDQAPAFFEFNFDEKVHDANPDSAPQSTPNRVDLIQDQLPLSRSHNLRTQCSHIGYIVRLARTRDLS